MLLNLSSAALVHRLFGIDADRFDASWAWLPRLEGLSLERPESVTPARKAEPSDENTDLVSL